MKKLLLAAVAVLPLLLTSCVTDRYGAGIGESKRYYADGHIQHRFYGRRYYYDPYSPHDAHARQRDGKDLRVSTYDSRYRTYENPYYPTAYLRRWYYYDPNSIHDAYARPRGPYRRQYRVDSAYQYASRALLIGGRRVAVTSHRHPAAINGPAAFVCQCRFSRCSLPAETAFNHLREYRHLIPGPPLVWKPAAWTAALQSD